MDTAAPPETTAPAPMTRADILKRLAQIKDDIEFYKEWKNAEFELALSELDFGPIYTVLRDDEDVAGCSDEDTGERLLVAERRSHRRDCKENIAELQEERKLLRLRLEAMPTEGEHD